MALPWYCIQTEPQREIRAMLSINGLGFKTCFPQIERVFSQVPGQKARTLIVPLWPRYGFAQMDIDNDPWGDILRQPGVATILRLVSGAGRYGWPKPVPGGLVEELQARGRAGDGVIDDHSPAFAPIEPGSRVRILDKAFAGHEGICTWSSGERVKLLLSLLGSEVTVSVARASAESV